MCQGQGDGRAGGRPQALFPGLEGEVLAAFDADPDARLWLQIVP